MSDQAGRLTTPSILDIIKDIMVESGWNPFAISVDNKHLTVKTENGGLWVFAAFNDEKIGIWPFATNDMVIVKPTNPKFIESIKEMAQLPKSGMYVYLWN